MQNSAGGRFGKDRLREAIRSSAAQLAAEIVRAILEHHAAFRGDCRPMDDVTFVIVKAKDDRSQ